MLSVVGVLFGGFMFLIRSSYRSVRRRAEAGENYQPEGKLRWGD
jgi:hypothetical protein